MRWRKRGHIFEPDGRFDWMRSHATVPAVDCRPDGLWDIYFTTKDAKHRSHISLLTFDPEKEEVLDVHSHAIVSPGRPGTFNDDGAMSGWVVRDGNHLRLYYQGFNQAPNVAFRVSIGLTEAPVDSRRFSGPIWPVLDRSENNPWFSGTPCILKVGAEWWMYYLSGCGWMDRQPRYGIRRARSADGLRWVSDSQLCIPLGRGITMIARPSVLATDRGFEMWFSERGDHSPYRMGYARSTDGAVWTRSSHASSIQPSAAGWDSEMICYQQVFIYKEQKYMLYCGNSYGKTGFGWAQFA